MRAVSRSPEARGREKGAVLMIVAVLLVVILGSAALVTDLGVFFVTRNQLQNVSDGSALAATRVLGTMYQATPFNQQGSFVCSADCERELRDTAIAVAINNRAAAVDVVLRDVDILVGQWDGDNFSPTLNRPDAVQVISRRDDLANGPVTTFFGKALGIETGSISAIAVAALSGQGSSAEGDVELPIGISSWFFDREDEDGFCNTDIQFYPTNDPASCAGWTSWDYGSNDITLRRILQGNPEYPSPETFAGSTFYNFTGGTLSNPTFDDLLTLFQFSGCDVDANWEYLTDDAGNCIQQATNPPGIPLTYTDNEGNEVRAYYPDGTPRNWHKWETTLPVYDRGDCSNPNQSILIVGFAQIELTDVLNAPDKLVRGKLVCHRVNDDDSRGGGGEYGLKGSIPGLVR
jgi:Flp pilus assembly protein TadG